MITMEHAMMSLERITEIIKKKARKYKVKLTKEARKALTEMVFKNLNEALKQVEEAGEELDEVEILITFEEMMDDLFSRLRGMKDVTIAQIDELLERTQELTATAVITASRKPKPFKIKDARGRDQFVVLPVSSLALEEADKIQLTKMLSITNPADYSFQKEIISEGAGQGFGEAIKFKIDGVTCKFRNTGVGVWVDSDGSTKVFHRFEFIMPDGQGMQYDWIDFDEYFTGFNVDEDRLEKEDLAYVLNEILHLASYNHETLQFLHEAIGLDLDDISKIRMGLMQDHFFETARTMPMANTVRRSPFITLPLLKDTHVTKDECVSDECLIEVNEAGEGIISRKSHEDIYLGYQVEDVVPEGMSHVEEVEDMVEEILEDYDTGAINKLQLNGRLKLLILVVRKATKGELATMKGKLDALSAINRARIDIGWNELDLWGRVMDEETRNEYTIEGYAPCILFTSGIAHDREARAMDEIIRYFREAYKPNNFYLLETEATTGSISIKVGGAPLGYLNLLLESGKRDGTPDLITFITSLNARYGFERVSFNEFCDGGTPAISFLFLFK